MGTSTFMSFVFVFSFLFCSSSQFVFTYHIIPQSFPILNSVIRYDVNFFLLLNQLLREVIKKRKVSRTKTCGCSYFLRKISFIGSQTCCPRHVFEISCNLLVCGGVVSLWQTISSSSITFLIFLYCCKHREKGPIAQKIFTFFCFFSLMEGKLT